jgi:hypothetical protein
VERAAAVAVVGLPVASSASMSISPPLLRAEDPSATAMLVYIPAHPLVVVEAGEGERLLLHTTATTCLMMRMSSPNPHFHHLVDVGNPA